MKSIFLRIGLFTAVTLFGPMGFATETGQERTNTVLIQNDTCSTNQSYAACKVRCPYCNNNKLDQPSAVQRGSSDPNGGVTGNE